LYKTSCTGLPVVTDINHYNKLLTQSGSVSKVESAETYYPLAMKTSLTSRVSTALYQIQETSLAPAVPGAVPVKRSKM